MPLSPGQKLGSYEIVSSLGTGGMGEVYRARDARLGRDVAVKILPPDVTNEPGRLERFDREARAIAALNHPHIVTIYSTEEADGVRFLTMELVDGCTLSDLVMSSGMAISRFLDIAVPLADALAAAHQKLITHRDLKPSNVMVSNDGRVKVLDFGLARVGRGDAAEQALIATQAPITNQGTIIGTMPYMSPEQVEGRPLDPRSDLFSLGVIFYELLTGDRPFKASSSPALMSAILRDTPIGVCAQRIEVPHGLERLVGRLLEKHPDDRVQTARDVFNELRHIRKQTESGHVQPPPRPAGAPAFSVAVRPFVARSAGEESTTLADGLTDDIINGLSRFGYLRVLSRAAASSNARYTLSGQVRKAGVSWRINATLVDTESGLNIWAEQYDRAESHTPFTIQDAVASSIVATIGDYSGVLGRTAAAALADRPIDQLRVPELIGRYLAFCEQFRPEEHARLRDGFERALAREPRSADGWGTLAFLYEQEHSQGLNPLPDSLGRQRRAAERAVELDSSSQLAWAALASAHLFSRDRQALLGAVDRAIAINPLNADITAECAVLLASVGEYDRAEALIRTALAQRSQPQGWFYFPLFNVQFARHEHEAALRSIKQANMPLVRNAQFGAAAVAGHLGLAAEARPALDALRAIDPHLLDPTKAREAWAVWMWDESFLDHLEDGFRKALALNGVRPPTAPQSTLPSSSAGSDAGWHGALSVAVLPFVARSSDEESKSLADGLPDDIAAGLSKFGYLRVLSRTATERLAREHTPINSQARYAVEGSVRRSGATVRVTVTLVNIETAASLWTSSYDRNAGSGMFIIQDDVASAVVATIGDQTGVLMRSMAASIGDLPLARLSVADLVLRYHLYAESFRPEEHGRLREAFERALEREPRAAEGWACLAMLYEHEHGFGFNRLPDALDRQRRAAERAVELDPHSQMAWISMASVNNFRRDLEGLKAAVERAVSLNPLNADLVALGGLFLSFAGENDRARELTLTAAARKPHHPGWYHYPLSSAYLAQGDYESALRENRTANLPMMPLYHLGGAASAGHVGNAAVAKTSLEGLRTISPALVEPGNARAFWAHWIWSDAHLDVLEAGFRKARSLAGITEPPSESTQAAAPSIAVLPFVDLSEKKDQDWFCDGMAEELLNALATLPGLRVAARASAFSFKGKTDDLKVIGEKLNVNTVLEGSVRRAGDRVRISTQLSDAREGRQIWSERFDRELKDIFDVQDEIARAIVDRLRLTLAGDTDRLVQKRTSNMAAYELLLKGRVLLYRRGPAILSAIECFQQAIALDPNLADAHAHLGDAYRLCGIYGLTASREAMTLARTSLERALALEPNQVEALATLANIMSAYEWRNTEARALSDRAIALDPGHVRALVESAITIAVAKAEPSSPALNELILERLRRARTLDPLSAWAMAIEAMALVLLDRDQEALDSSARAIATDPDNFTAHWSRVFTLMKVNRRPEAQQAAEAALEMSRRHPFLLSELATMRALDGDAAQADAIYQELTARATTGFVSPGALAIAAAGAGRMGDARRHLARTIDDHDSFITFHKLPVWQLVWRDAECAAMLRNSALMQDAPQ